MKVAIIAVLANRVHSHALSIRPTKYVHIKSTTVYAPRRNWDSPQPPTRRLVCPLPPVSGGRGTLAGEKGVWRFPIPTRGIHCGTPPLIEGNKWFDQIFHPNESPRRTGLHSSLSAKSNFYLPAFEISRSCRTASGVLWGAADSDDSKKAWSSFQISFHAAECAE
jgi:hypothetical protein